MPFDHGYGLLIRTLGDFSQAAIGGAGIRSDQPGLDCPEPLFKYAAGDLD
jgi:hypothetical protein